VTVRLAVVGAGAFGVKHLQALAHIDDVEVVAVVSDDLAQAHSVADRFDVPEALNSYEAVLARPDIDAVLLCTPTPLHTSQTKQALLSGKHVQVEIPLAESWREAREIGALAKDSGLVCMVGHTRRYNPSHQWVHQRIAAGEFTIQSMDIQTFFFRRTNVNALGEPRSWTDSLLWHHAAHSVDLFQYQTGRPLTVANALAGPLHPELGIPMDLSIQLKTDIGQICTIALSFNNEGPIGSHFRYIGDTATYVAHYDDLFTGNGEQIDLTDSFSSSDGVELQDRDFIGSVLTGHRPLTSIEKIIHCYETLGVLEGTL